MPAEFPPNKLIQTIPALARMTARAVEPCSLHGARTLAAAWRRGGGGATATAAVLRTPPCLRDAWRTWPK